MRTDPDPTGTEVEVLAQYLDYQRETVIIKTESLTSADLNCAHLPSALTLGGLLFHLALVEETWFETRFAGLPERDPWNGVDWDTDPEWEFRTAVDFTPDQLRSRYRAACERSRAVVAGANDLGQLSAAPMRDGTHFSLRWVMLHLIEETARHAGHADLIRESIDGSIGE